MENQFDLDSFEKTINNYVDEMYSMEKEGAIFQLQGEFYFGDAHLTRKRIQHIVEERKKEGRSRENIKKLICYLPEVITNPDFELPNTNLRHQGSIMRVKLLKGNNGGGVATGISSRPLFETRAASKS